MYIVITWLSLWTCRSLIIKKNEYWICKTHRKLSFMHDQGKELETQKENEEYVNERTNTQMRGMAPSEAPTKPFPEDIYRRRRKRDLPPTFNVTLKGSKFFPIKMNDYLGCQVNPQIIYQWRDKISPNARRRQNQGKQQESSTKSSTTKVPRATTKKPVKVFRIGYHGRGKREANDHKNWEWVTLRAYKVMERCYLDVFEYSQDQSVILPDTVTTHNPVQRFGPIRPGYGCTWSMPEVMFDNCHKDLYQCVVFDILSPSLVKPGKLNISIKMYHQQIRIDFVNISIKPPNQNTTILRLTCNSSLLGYNISLKQHTTSRYCISDNDMNKFRELCVINYTINVMVNHSGLWTVRGPLEFEYTKEIHVVTPPPIYHVGPLTIKKDVTRTLMIDPQYSIKRIIMPLQLSITSVYNQCVLYTEPLLVGWRAWVQGVLPPSSNSSTRQKRDLVAKVLGGVGAGLSVLNTVDQQILANRIGQVGHDAASLAEPLTSAFHALGTTTFDITKILPYWLKIQEQDHLRILGALDILQSNISEALACVEAQQWLITVAKAIIRDGFNQQLPLELKKIIYEDTNDFEKIHHQWWQLLTFTYFQHNDTIMALILTLKSANQETIYPLVALGIYANQSLLVPIEEHKWVHVNANNSYVPINLQACVYQPNLGYTCTTQVWEEDSTCLDPVEGTCSYEVFHHSLSKASAIVQVDSGCFCIRSLCPYFLVNNLYKVNNSGIGNLCICKVIQLMGCDINVSVHNVYIKDVFNEYKLYNTLTPIHVGANLEVIRKLLHHEKLAQYLNNLKLEGSKTILTVQHSISEIRQITKKIKDETTSAHWWESILYTDMGSIRSMWYILLHPVVVVLIIQFILIVYVVLLTVLICKHKKARRKYKQVPFNISGWNAL
uniref:Uncharacterized protein n=1 Tax=Terrapene triunguis TaxID=2587831 RepID=A0A674J513_9SAUR